MTAVLFNARALPAGSFIPSTPVFIHANRLTLDFTVVVAGGATQVQFFLEYASADPNALNTPWFREVAEIVGAGGVVAMPKIVRSFQENGGANLATGVHNMSMQFDRHYAFARLQAGIVGGGGTALMTAVDPFGSQPVSP